MPSAMNTKHNTRIDEWTFSKAQSFDLGGALGFLFRRLNSLSNAIFAEVSGQQDLTAMQMGILLTVHRSEEHTSELQSLMRISYAVFCLKKTKYTELQTHKHLTTHINLTKQ